MTAVEDFLLLKAAAQEDRKQRELELWKRWKKTQEPEHLEPLFDLYKPVIAQKMTQWRAPAVPPAAFRAELHRHLIHAFDTYDPSRGAALNTHVDIRLRKAQRYNNRYQNLAYIPEAQAAQIGKIDRGRDTLTEELGREPTSAELAQHIGLPVPRVERIQKARMRDIRASDFETDPTERTPHYEEQQLTVASQILPQLFPEQPDMHKLFNHIYGTNGAEQITSTGQLARVLGKSPSQVSRMKSHLGTTLKGRMGLY